jgi:hypothetical protein
LELATSLGYGDLDYDDFWPRADVRGQTYLTRII